jgi:DNA-binding NarL/FixJ family response regulator
MVLNAPQLVSVLLVDDNCQFRRGLETLLNFYTDDCYLQFRIVGEATNAEQGVRLALEQNPTLILLALELSPLLAGLREHNYRGKALILANTRQDEAIYRAMQWGARGVVAKERLGSQLYDAISIVMNDEIFLAPDIAAGFFRMFHFYGGRTLMGDRTIHLTEREAEVLHWLVQGASNEQIARYLFVTVATVKAHLTAIFEKLGVISRTQAIVKALKLGLVSV